MTVIPIRQHRRQTAFLLLIAGLFFACQSQEDQVREVVLNYTQARVLNAPYRAYVFISAEDKRYISVEKFTERDDLMEPVAYQRPTLAVPEITLREGQALAKAVVNGTDKDGNALQNEYSYVLVQEDQRWRIYLDLETLDKTRERLDRAESRLDLGRVQEARSELDEIELRPFRGSDPDVVTARIKEVEKLVDFKAREDSLRRRLLEAHSLNDIDLQEEISRLDRELPEDGELRDRLNELSELLKQRRVQSARAILRFENIRIRRNLRQGLLFRDVVFQVVNNTGVPITGLTVKVDYKNGDEVVDFSLHQLVSRGQLFSPGDSIEFDEEIVRTPDGWNGREISVSVHEMELAGE